MATQTQSRVNGNGTQKSESGPKQRPAWTKKGFPLQIAVFEFPTENGSPNFSVKLTRTFRRDENSPWETSEYLSGSDCLRAAQLLESADAFVQSRLEAEYVARKESQENF